VTTCNDTQDGVLRCSKELEHRGDHGVKVDGEWRFWQTGRPARPSRTQLAAMARTVVLRPPQTLARTTDPSTSFLAAIGLEPTNILRMRAAILHLVWTASDNDYERTDEGIAERYEALWRERNWPSPSPSGLRTRRAELVDDGWLINSGRKTIIHTGNPAIVWDIPEEDVHAG
jgi:hypothetical protein